MKREGRGGGAEWRSWGERREASQQARLWAEWHDLCFLNSLDLVCVQAFNSWLKSSCFFFWGARFWGRGVDMSLFLTSLLLVLDQDAYSMCCAVG